MSRIPADLIAKHLEIAKTTTFFGIPLLDLTHEELIVCAVVAGRLEQLRNEEGPPREARWNPADANIRLG